jgi:hypothetical protein
MRIVVAMVAAGALAGLVNDVHAEAQTEPEPVVVAGLPSSVLAPVAQPTPATPVQQQTCGCTSPPNPKQKIMVRSGGRNVCTVTQIACWAP